MSREDYISRLFKKKVSNLEQEPREEVWNRLQSRLDGQFASKASNRSLHGAWQVKMTWTWSTAAAIMVVGLSFWALWPKAGLEELGKEASGLAEQVEQVKTKEQDSPLNPSHKALSLEEEDSKPVEELVKPSLSPVFEAVKEVEQPKIESTSRQNFNADQGLSLENRIWEEPKTQEDFFTAAQLEQNQGLNAGPSVRTVPPPPPPSPKSNAAPAPPSPAPLNSTILMEQEQEARSNKRVAEARAEKEAKSLPKLRASPDKSKKDEAEDAFQMQPALASFTWLLGSWEDVQDHKNQSWEEWRLLDAQTLLGRGYRREAGALVFEEEFRLTYVAESKDLILSLSLEHGGALVPYRLQRSERNAWTFTQTQRSDYPQYLILKREARGQFSLTMERQGGVLKPEQERYLQKRNRVSNTRISRRLAPKGD